MCTHTDQPTERFFVVADACDPGSEVPTYEEACRELDTLRAQGAEDPRILFMRRTCP